jgi:hypothetical protein
MYVVMKCNSVPVVAADGYTYEREAIEQWFSTRSRSPMTNQTIATKVTLFFINDRPPSPSCCCVL